MTRAEYMTEQLQELSEAVNEINIKIEQIDQAKDTIRKIIWNGPAGAAAIRELDTERSALLENKDNLSVLLEETRQRAC